MKYSCTFYTEKNTTTTDMLFGEVNQDAVDKSLILDDGSEIELDIKITGAYNLIGGNAFLLRQEYLEVFLEGAFSIDEVLLPPIEKEEVLPINSIVKIRGTVRFF